MLKTDAPRGILHPDLQQGEIVHRRWHAEIRLQPFIEHFWMVRWNLQGQADQNVETIPYPSVHMVYEDGQILVHGVSQKKFKRVLSGKSFVFGAKFLPGAFRSFLGKPVSSIRDKRFPASGIFGSSVLQLEQAISTAATEDIMLAAFQDFFLPHIPPRDEKAELVASLLRSIIDDRSVTQAAQLCERSHLSLRSLQRLFTEYAGLSPKWIICRYRIHDAIERIRQGQHQWPALAYDLGYADQAHFIRDFKTITGQTPQQFFEKEKARFISQKAS